MPQGGIDPGEDIEEAAKRELIEEVGSDNIKVIKVAENTVCYDLPAHLRDTLWNGQYRGQEQYWVAARYLGTDEDIDIKHHPLPEFQQWKWIPLKETLNLIVPFKREVYQNVIEMFEDIT